MDYPYRWLAILLLTLVTSTGCVNERVYRCNDSNVPLFSGRYNDGSCGSSGSCSPGGSCGRPNGKLFGSPLALLKRKCTCGKGCGEVFWDEWFSDPPDDCDPCDECSGQFVGHERCCPPKLSQKVGSLLMGGRHSSACGSACGCSNGSCGADFEASAEMSVGEEEAAEEEPYYQPQSTPPSSSQYYPYAPQIPVAPQNPASPQNVVPSKPAPKAEKLPAPQVEPAPMVDPDEAIPKLPTPKLSVPKSPAPEASRRKPIPARSASFRR